MAQFVLEILDGDRAGEVLSLAEGTLRIGRKAGNDLVLADEKASGVHAEVAFDGGRYVLRDLGSTNGTMMDGRKVTEVVLGRGDTFAIGRIRLRFSAEGEPKDLSTQEIALGRIDAARLQAAKGQGRGRSATTMVLVLVLLVAAGGYFWFTLGGQNAGDGGGVAANGPQKVMQVAGNRLDAEAASCESETGWDLRLAGVGFAAGGSGHTGRAGFEAVRSADGADFAVAATAVEQKVLAGRSLTAAAHLRTSGEARACLRLTFWSSNEQVPFRFRTGTDLAASPEWQRREVVAAVPPGADRCRLEIVAVLPSESSRVQFDDVALVESGEAQAVESKVGESATVIGTGQSLAVRSMDTDAPATLLSIHPADVAPELRALAAADQLAMSDLGAAVTATVDEFGVQFAVTGCSTVELDFPLENSGGLLVEDDQGFTGADPEALTACRRILLGDRSTRCLVELAASALPVGKAGNGRYRLTLPAASFRLQVGFRQERARARELLREAESDAAAGAPGKALDGLRELLRTVPHDAETAAAVVARRGDWQQVVQERLRQLAIELEDAEFFDTRGGFQRVVAEIDRLFLIYGKNNVEDPQGMADMRGRAEARLVQLDSQRASETQKRLQAMAAAFDAAQQAGLANLVRSYVTQRFGKQE
ncbi:MAG: FHA domain-containing protein [Planctomycetota bacterium]